MTQHALELEKPLGDLPIRRGDPGLDGPDQRLALSRLRRRVIRRQANGLSIGEKRAHGYTVCRLASRFTESLNPGPEPELAGHVVWTGRYGATVRRDSDN